MTETTMQLSDTETMLREINESLDLCPSRGLSKSSEAVRKFWVLGFAQGASAGLTLAVNRLCNPAHSGYDKETIIHKVILPLLVNRDVASAETAVKELIHQTWA